LPAIAFAGKYTPAMYEKAIVPDTLVKTVLIHDTVVVRDTLYKDESGKSLSQQYHIVIGSFQDKLNARNLLDQVMQKGEGSPSIATSPEGKFRVLYFSSDNEEEARKVLSQIKEEYPSAWLLNLKK